MNDAVTKRYEFLLAGVIAARATSFIFSKMILQTMDTFNLLAVRFLIAFVLLAVLFHKDLAKITKKVFAPGTVIGLLFFLTMSCELTALTRANSSLVSMLENCSIIFVPIFEAIQLKRLPGKITAASTLAAMSGVVLLGLQQGNISGGFLFGLLAAVCYSGAIMATARLTQENEDTLSIGIIQVGTIGILALGASYVFEQPHLPQTMPQWLMLAMLVIVCTGFGFTLQPVAQSHVAAERAGLFCAISPALSALLGVFVLHETIGVLGVLGLLLILASIVLPYIKGTDKVW